MYLSAESWAQVKFKNHPSWGIQLRRVLLYLLSVSLTEDDGFLFCLTVIFQVMMCSFDLCQFSVSDPFSFLVLHSLSLTHQPAKLLACAGWI